MTARSRSSATWRSSPMRVRSRSSGAAIPGSLPAAPREAAVASGDEDLAVLYGEIVESPPGAWLLRPLRVPAGATAELIVSMPEGLRFVAGLPQGSLSASGLGELPYAAFGDLRVERLRSEGGSPTVAIAKARRHQSEEELLGWIRSSAAL